jgi:hypothetical protein
MAKARDIAALAGLAGLAYANRDKLFGGKKTYNEDAGDQKTSSYTGDNKKVSASDDRMSNEDYIKSRTKKAPEAEDANYGNEGRRTSMGVSSVSKSAPKTAAPAKITSASDARTSETNKTRGRPAEPKNPNYSNEGRSSTAPSKNPNYSNEGRSSTAPTVASKVGDVAKDVAVTAVKAANPVAAAAYKFGTTPTPEQASANRQAAYDKVKSVGSSVANYVKNFETPAERRSREAKEASGKKHGGSIKMASGGMTASRRGDGIATKGKTRGRIC